jgi:hypothetical protein
MNPAIPLGQVIGDIVWIVILVAAGAYARWGWPRSIRRKLAAGELSQAQAEEKLRKAPKTGYIMWAVAACSLATSLFQWFS